MSDLGDMGGEELRVLREAVDVARQMGMPDDDYTLAVSGLRRLREWERYRAALNSACFDIAHDQLEAVDGKDVDLNDPRVDELTAELEAHYLKFSPAIPSGEQTKE